MGATMYAVQDDLREERSIMLVGASVNGTCSNSMPKPSNDSNSWQLSVMSSSQSFFSYSAMVCAPKTCMVHFMFDRLRNGSQTTIERVLNGPRTNAKQRVHDLLILHMYVLRACYN